MMLAIQPLSRPGVERFMKPSSTERLEPLIFTIRGHRVLLDADLARLYGVETFRFNEAFKRNRHRFPNDFAFQLTGDDLRDLRSQFAISSSQSIDSSEKNQISSQFAMRSHGGRRYLPWAFTEHGALMAANVLRSPAAVKLSKWMKPMSAASRRGTTAKATSTASLPISRPSFPWRSAGGRAGSAVWSWSG